MSPLMKSDGPTVPTADETDQRRSSRRVWSLDQPALASLLLVLHADPDQAALAYEILRQKLIRFFTLHRVGDSDGFADTCLDRLAKRVHQGVEVENPGGYAVGIARMLLREERTAQRRHEVMVEDLSRTMPASPGDDVVIQGIPLHELEQYLQQCLGHLSSTQQKQILLYYSAAAREGIDIRQQMATESNLSLNAFRNRMLRLRKLLEDCLMKRIACRDRKRPGA